MKSVLLASVLALGSVAPVLLVETQASHAQTLEQISGIQVQSTDQGIQIGIQTTSGSAPRFLPPSPNYRNVLVIDLLDTQLSEGSLSESNPAPGILSVSLDRRMENSVRLTIIGSEQLPNVIVQAGDPGVMVTLGGSQAPVAAQPTPIPTVDPTPMVVKPEANPTPAPEVPDLELAEIRVRADRPDTYRPTNSTVGSGTDTPIRDIPQSIQVVPQQVLVDQQARKLIDGLLNVSGISSNGTTAGTREYTIIRGFESYGNFLVNGFPDPQITSDSTFIHVESLEVLKGPASALYGDTGFSALGGTVNVVTKQPQP